MLFLSIMRVDYVVQRVEQTGSYNLSLHDSSSSPSTGDDVFADLYMTISPRRDWCLNGCDFDIYLLAMDTQRMYVRAGAQARLPSYSRLACTDPFMYLMHRMMTRTFTLIDGGRTLLNNQRAMSRAHQLVKEGWIMDDAVLGWNGWLFTTFRDLHVNRRVPKAALNDTCPLCLEAFAPDDVIVNLCCGHTFHYTCSPSPAQSEEGRGLKAWLNGVQQNVSHSEDPLMTDSPSGHNTCPYCRAII